MSRWSGASGKIRGDRVLLGAAHVLTAVGFAAMISRPDPLRDLLLFPRYAEGVMAGLAVAAALSFINVRTSRLKALSYLPLAAAFVLSLLLLSPLGSGPAGSGAKVNLGPFQPIEAIRILLALFLAGYFSRHWELLRAVRSDRIGSLNVPSWINLPRARYALPVLIGVGAALALFFGQKDLGPALMLAVVFLAVYAVARGTIGMALAGRCCWRPGFISATSWRSRRRSPIAFECGARPGTTSRAAAIRSRRRSGSMATGAPFGTGPGLGDTRYLPAGHTDLVLASICRGTRICRSAAIGLVYAAIVVRALRTARRASTDYGFFLAVTLALFLVVPVLLMMSGTLGLVPLTGVVTPFLSFGGSAMVANFAALGLLGVDSFRRRRPRGSLGVPMPVRWLGGGLARRGRASCSDRGARTRFAVPTSSSRSHISACRPTACAAFSTTRGFSISSAAFRGAASWIAMVWRWRPTMRGSRGGGAGLRARSASRWSPRAPIPTRGVIRWAAAPFTCSATPTTRRNWSASNTSFVERDSESGSRLRRSPDDGHVVESRTARKTTAAAARLSRSRRRLCATDTSRIIRPSKAAMDPHRELRLTIDARLQARVAAIIAAVCAPFVERSRRGGRDRSGDRRSARERQLSLAV